MAAVRGLCNSIVGDTVSSHTTRLSSSTSRRNAHFSNAAVRHLSKKCRVIVAVMVDAKVHTTSSTKIGSTGLKLEQAETGILDSRLLELVDSTIGSKILQRRLQGASPLMSTEKSKPVMGQTDTDLKSTLEHRLWVAFAGTVVTGMLAKAFSACQSSEDVLQVAVGAIAAWTLSDLATGVYHWGIDNYGDATTPIFGAQIDAFQGHHQRPWTITKRQFANNIHAIARPAGIFLTPFLLLPSHPLFDSFLGLFLGLVVMSQQFHALSHMKKSQLPAYVVALQDKGVLLGRKMHGTHHKPPYDINYCIVSGLWNPLLNEIELFKRMERILYAKWGVAPRAWSETSEEWLQMDSYFEDGTDFDPSQSS